MSANLIPSEQARETQKYFTEIQESGIHTRDTQELPGRWWDSLKTQGKSPMKAKPPRSPSQAVLPAQGLCFDLPCAGLRGWAWASRPEDPGSAGSTRVVLEEVGGRGVCQS